MAITITATPIQNGIEVTGATTTISASGISIGNTSAGSMGITSVSGLSATNVQDALEEIAGNTFQQDGQPSGSQVNEGDTWYDTDDNQYKSISRNKQRMYFEWVPIIVGAAADDSDTLDAGAF